MVAYRGGVDGYRHHNRAAGDARASDGTPVYLADIWPSADEVQATICIHRQRMSPADIGTLPRRRPLEEPPHPSKGTSFDGASTTSKRLLYFSTICGVTVGLVKHLGCAASWHCWATRSPQTTFHRPVIKADTARQESTSVSTAERANSELLRFATRQPRSQRSAARSRNRI